MKKEESKFSRKVQEKLRAREHYVVKYHGNQYSVRGTPDLLACINGKFVGIELKTEKGSLSDLQEEQMCKIRNAGGWTAIIKKGDDIEEMIQKIEEYTQN